MQSPSTPENTSVTTLPYTQAQITSDPNIPTTFNITMIHTNPLPNIVNSRTLSRPLYKQFQPTHYNIVYLAQIHILHNILYLPYNITLKQILQVIPYNIKIFQYHQPPLLELIRILHLFTSQILTNSNNLQTNTSHPNYHITHPYTQPPKTISTPTYINSSTSISMFTTH